MPRILVGIALLLVPLTALAQSDEGGIDLVDVSGPLDASAMEFMTQSIMEAAAAGQELIVLQINSKAALDSDALNDLMLTIDRPPIPVAIWVGPAPAAAYGGIAQLVLNASEKSIAPGSEIGLALPTVAGDPAAPLLIDESLVEGYEGVVVAGDTDLELQPTIRQYLQDLNGRTFLTVEGPVVVETVEEFTQDGEAGVTIKTVTFIKPGLGLRFFRLGVTPEAAFFFLVVGLSIISFEFFAIGPGVAAAFGALSLLIAGWGVVNLPVQWWALTLAISGWILLTVSYQKGGVIAFTGLGAVMLQIGGMFFIDGSGQIDARWWLILPSVLAVLFFFVLAMPTVQRARFSTQVLGREGLVGASGVALVDFDPDGLVEVNNARWRATAHREAGIARGSAVMVTGVDGLFLEVEPISSEREN